MRGQNSTREHKKLSENKSEQRCDVSAKIESGKSERTEIILSNEFEPKNIKSGKFKLSEHASPIDYNLVKVS